MPVEWIEALAARRLQPLEEKALPPFVEVERGGVQLRRLRPASGLGAASEEQPARAAEPRRQRRIGGGIAGDGRRAVLSEGVVMVGGRRARRSPCQCHEGSHAGPEDPAHVGARPCLSRHGLISRSAARSTTRRGASCWIRFSRRFRHPVTTNDRPRSNAASDSVTTSSAVCWSPGAQYYLMPAVALKSVAVRPGQQVWITTPCFRASRSRAAPRLTRKAFVAAYSVR